MMSNDIHTETITRSYGSRLGDSLKGILFGLALLVGATLLIWYNEGRSVERSETLSQGLAATHALPQPLYDPINDGKLLHLSGELRGGSLLDPLFGVHAKGVMLMRHVTMYQWHEEISEETKQELGGKETITKTYRYQTAWSDSPIDSSYFKKPIEHQNPPFAYTKEQFDTTATLGDFTLEPRLVHEADGWRNHTPQNIQTVTEAKLVGDALYIGANPATPQVGDVKITYTIVPEGLYSVIARQNPQKILSFYTTPNLGEIAFIQAGIHTSEAIFAQAKRENSIMAWGLRALGLLLMFSGFMLVMGPLSTLASVVPFLGNLVGIGTALIAAILTLILGGGIIVIAWFAHRPWLAGVLLLLIAAFVYWGIRRKKAA